MILSVDVSKGNDDVTPRPYWSLRDVIARAEPFRGTEEDAADRLDTLLRDAVRLRMEADVPLGAFLSGGVDSSIVVALMQAESSRPVRTFTIGFHEAAFNEAEDAGQVARHLGTEHVELYVEPSHALEIIPELPRWYDEPFADSSQVPTALVSEMTRRHVTVALSGDGGDELFAGYARYDWACRIVRAFGRIPGGLRGGLARSILAVPTAAIDTMARFLPKSRMPTFPGDKLHKLAEGIVADGATRSRFEDLVYLRLLTLWENPEAVVRGAREPRGPFHDETLGRLLPEFVPRMQFLDLLTYLPDDILTKVDRASMAFALEARVPLLDHRVVEFLWTLPLSMKVRGGERKWLLRRLLERYVPRALVSRPKTGFGVPIDSWLRGPLRDWAESLLDEEVLRADGFLDPVPVRRRWQEHLSGRRNWHYSLWCVLMFQAWRERWR
jgi:asparagine synthase (glutamine-hydrolysing)